MNRPQPDKLGNQWHSLSFKLRKQFPLCLDALHLHPNELREQEEVYHSYTNPRLNVLLNRRESLAKLRRDLNFTPRARDEKAAREKGTKLADLLK